MDLEQLKKDTKEILVDVLEKSRLRQGQILVLGMSSSEVAGGQIGKASNIDIAEAIVQILLDELNPRGIYLAVQGCEHLNRALVVERELADKKELESSMSFRVSMQEGPDNSQLSSILRILWKWNSSQLKQG